jgi:hypothetical protein
MSLTKPQILLHWRSWRACQQANDWVEVDGRLSADAQATAGLSIQHKLVWRQAQELAVQQHAGIRADDLRHACYLVATTAMPGASANRKPVDSMTALDNVTFSRVLVLWKLLIDPDDIGAGMDWEHPENSQRQAYLKGIPKIAPDAVVRAIAANAFGTRLWEDLELQQLRWLLRTLREKQKSYNQPKMASTNAPF